jgi:hypothetical protein
MRKAGVAKHRLDLGKSVRIAAGRLFALERQFRLNIDFFFNCNKVPN